MPRTKPGWSPEVRQSIIFLLSIREQGSPIGKLFGTRPAQLDLRLPADHSRKKARQGLRDLVTRGCDEKIILACVRVLAEPRRSLKFPRPDTQREIEDLENAAESLRRLRRDHFFRASNLYPLEESRAIYGLPDILEDYAAKISLVSEGLKRLYRGDLLRSVVLETLGDHIHTKTGRYYWPVVADLVAGFQEASDKTVDENALRIAYKRSKATKHKPH